MVIYRYYSFDTLIKVSIYLYLIQTFFAADLNLKWPSGRESSIGFSGSGISLIWISEFGILKQNPGEIRDWKYRWRCMRQMLQMMSKFLFVILLAVSWAVLKL